MSCVWVLQRGHSGDGCDLASTLCISSELLLCSGGVRSILLLPLVAICLEPIDVYGACLFLWLL